MVKVVRLRSWCGVLIQINRMSGRANSGAVPRRSTRVHARSPEIYATGVPALNVFIKVVVV